MKVLAEELLIIIDEAVSESQGSLPRSFDFLECCPIVSLVTSEVQPYYIDIWPRDVREGIPGVRSVRDLDIREDIALAYAVGDKLTEIPLDRI